MRHFNIPLRDFIIDFEALWTLLPCGWHVEGVLGKKKETRKICREALDNKLVFNKLLR